MEIISIIVAILMGTGTILLGVFAIPYLKNLAEKYSLDSASEKDKILSVYASWAAKWAEQVLPEAKGPEKLKQAIQKVVSTAEANGVDISREKAEILLENVVYELNQLRGGRQKSTQIPFKSLPKELQDQITAKSKNPGQPPKKP